MPWNPDTFDNSRYGRGAGFGRADVVAAVRQGATLQQISDYLDTEQGRAAIPGGGTVDQMVDQALQGEFSQAWGTFKPHLNEEQANQQLSFIGQADYDIYRAMGKSDLQIQEYVEQQQSAGNPTYGSDNTPTNTSGLGYQIQQSAQSTRANQALSAQVDAINQSTAAANARQEQELAEMGRIHEEKLAEAQRLHDERIQLMHEQELQAQERAAQVKIRGTTQVQPSSALGIRQRQSPFARAAAKGTLQLSRSHKGNQAVTGLNV